MTTYTKQMGIRIHQGMMTESLCNFLIPDLSLFVNYSHSIGFLLKTTYSALSFY